MRALLFALVLTAGCGATVQWRHYAPFRIAGAERFVTPVDPAEIHYAGVLPKLHYVSLTLDGLFFRNLPRTIGRQVALGISLSGAVPGRDLQTISEPVSAQGPDGLLYFERPFAVDPFLYDGRPLRLTLTLRDVGPSEATNLRGRLLALGLTGASKLVPGLKEKLDQHARQFEAFLGGAYKGKVYSYTFSLYPSDMENVRPDLVLTGGRHVYVGFPGAGAPKSVRRLKPADVVYKLRLAGRRLEWRHDGKEYVESPYLLLSVIRHKRYPSADTALRQAVRKVDRFIEQGNWTLARSGLPDIGAALIADRSLTQLEKNLEISWRDARAARIDAGEALERGDKGAALAALVRQAKLLGDIGRDFQPILEPAEVKDLAFQVKRLSRQAEELAAQAGVAAEPWAASRQELAAALAGIKPPAEPPANPSLTLKPPEVVVIKTEVPTPFYKQWWFYVAMGAIGVAGASVGGYYGLRQEDPKLGPSVPFRGKAVAP